MTHKFEGYAYEISNTLQGKNALLKMSESVLVGQSGSNYSKSQMPHFGDVYSSVELSSNYGPKRSEKLCQIFERR